MWRHRGAQDLRLPCDRHSPHQALSTMLPSPAVLPYTHRMLSELHSRDPGHISRFLQISPTYSGVGPVLPKDRSQQAYLASASLPAGCTTSFAMLSSCGCRECATRTSSMSEMSSAAPRSRAAFAFASCAAAVLRSLLAIDLFPANTVLLRCHLLSCSWSGVACNHVALHRSQGRGSWSPVQM